MTLYRIMGRHKGQVEELDQTKDRREANCLVAEYQMAFGPTWKVWIEEQTYRKGMLTDCG